ncbi:unnamed protein product [Trichobilharzia szidati]|nr:unnamed protein product [Trichobilharzia szidati]
MNDYIYMLPIPETFDNTSQISIANTNNNNSNINNTKNYFTTITAITSTKTVTTENVIFTNVSNDQKTCYVTEPHYHGSISSFCPTLVNVQKSDNNDDNGGCYATDEVDDDDDENGFKSVHQNTPVFYHSNNFQSNQTWPTGNNEGNIPQLNKFEGIYPSEWNADNKPLTSDTYPSIQPDSITPHNNNNSNTTDYHFSPNTNYLSICNSNSYTTPPTTTTTTNTITSNNSDNNSKTGNLNNTRPIPTVSHGYTYQQGINSSVYEQPAYAYDNNNNNLLGKCINKPDYPHSVIISTATLPSLTCHHPNHQHEQQQQQSSIIESNATEQHQQQQQQIQNASTHFSYEICNNNNNNRSIKDYSKSSTGLVYSNEDTNLHNQILSNPITSTNCHIPNLHESTRVKTNRHSGVNSSHNKCLYSLRTGLSTSRKHRPSIHTMHGKSSELLFRSNQQTYSPEYHRQAPKTNRLTQKLTYRTTATTTAIANTTTTTSTTVASTSSNNIINSNFSYNLKSPQNHSTPLNNTTCQLIDSINNNTNSVLKQTTSQMNAPVKHSINYEMCSKLKQNKALTSSNNNNNNNGSILTRSPYKCRKCKGHGMSEPVRQHKRNCPFRDCTCDMCYLVEKGRRIVAQQIALFRDQKSHNSHYKYLTHSKDPRSSSLSLSSSTTTKEIITMKGALDRIAEDIGPHCRRCRNHGQSISWKGHKKTCPYRECYCNQCILISLRKSNEKDLREVAQEFTENRLDKGAMKPPLKATKVNSELNIHSADTKHQKHQTNLLSAYRMLEKNIGSEGYNENIVSNSRDQIFPDRFHFPSVAKNCTNSWIHQLVTSSVATSSSVSSSSSLSSSSRPSYETNIGQCDNLSCPSDYPSTIPTHLNIGSTSFHTVLQETFTKPFQTTQNALSLVREYNNNGGIVDSTNFINDELTSSQKLNPTHSMSVNSSYNDLSMIQCRTSTTTTSSTGGSKTLSDKLTDSNPSCPRRLPDYCSPQGYFNSGLPTTATTSMTTSTINHLFKSHDLVNSTDNSTNYASSQFSKDHVLYESLGSKDEPEASALHPLPNNNIIEPFPFEFNKSDRVSVFCQNLIDSVKSKNNDYNDYYSNSSQFKPNYSSYSSNVNKSDTMNEFFPLNGNQEINSCHIVAPSSLITNTPVDYNQFTEVIQSSHEEKLVGVTAAAAAAHHVAALAAAVAYHHQQQKHQHDYYYIITIINNTSGTNNTIQQQQQPGESRTEQEQQNNQPMTSEHMNALPGSLSVPLNFSNMYNNNNNNIVTTDNKGLNQTTESIIIKPPLLESFKTVYTQKTRQSSEEIYIPSLKKELNKFSREFFDGSYNNHSANNSSYTTTYSPTYLSNHHHQIREHHQHDAYHPHPHQQHQQQQQEEQSYSMNDTFINNENVNIKQLSTIKQKNQLYDYQSQSHQHHYNGMNKHGDDQKSVPHQTGVQINQEINKLQIIHLTNAIILPPQQSVGQTQQEINGSINNNINNINCNNNNTSWPPYYNSLVKTQQINQSNETDYRHQQQRQQHQQQQQSYKHEITSTDNFSSMMSTTDLNSLPSEYCSNLFKKFEPSDSLFKQQQIGIEGGGQRNNNNNSNRID